MLLALHPCGSLELYGVVISFAQPVWTLAWMQVKDVLLVAELG